MKITLEALKERRASEWRRKLPLVAGIVLAYVAIVTVLTALS